MKILITRKLRDRNTFAHHLPGNAEVREQSFIEIQSTPFTVPKDISWIFFSSKNAVSSFLDQHPIPADIKIGAVSEATANYLKEHSYHCDYIGDASKSTEKNAVEFAEISDGKVFFPSSDRSLLTFPKALNNERIIVKNIYKTTLSDIKVDEQFDYYLFTSPSNVDGYLLSNQFYKDGKIIAIGNSTAKRILEINNKLKVHVSEESSEIGLAKKIKEVADSD